MMRTALIQSTFVEDLTEQNLRDFRDLLGVQIELRPRDIVTLLVQRANAVPAPARMGV